MSDDSSAARFDQIELNDLGLIQPEKAGERDLYEGITVFRPSQLMIKVRQAFKKPFTAIRCYRCLG